MSKTIVLMMAVTSVLVYAQGLVVADGPGVTVNLNGSQLMHRTPVNYPADALAKGVEGTVVVQVRLNSQGEVTDDTVLSGPDELRKSVQLALLSWHFDARDGSLTRVVNISFVKPAGASVVPMIVRSADPVPERTVTQVHVENAPAAIAPRSGAIDQIDVAGLSDTATAALLAQLPVHAGDPFTADSLTRAREASRAFDSHLTVSMSSGPAGANVMTIRPQGALGAPPAPQLTVPAGASVIASNVEASNLINAERPVYPPLAKMARQQGTVKFQATIGKDGNVDDLLLISGPPLLVQSAMDAVKKWTYKPMVLNGAPVQVVTTIDVNLSLSQ
jgi:TonB family protein